MPIYEYLCKKCNTHQERHLPMSDYKTPQYCKKCNSVLTRIISRLAVKIPAWWSGHGDNAIDISKPQNEEQQKKYKDFMENSIPISQSTK